MSETPVRIRVSRVLRDDIEMVRIEVYTDRATTTMDKALDSAGHGESLINLKLVVNDDGGHEVDG